MTKTDNSDFADFTIEELLPLYALGGLSPEENAAVEKYLASHPQKRVEVEELSVAAALLAEDVDSLPPPPSVRRAVMAHAAASRVENTSEPKVISYRPAVPSPWSRLAGWWRRLKAGPTFPLATAVGLAFIAFLAIRLFSLQGELETLSAQNRLLTEAVLSQEQLVTYLTDEGVSQIPVDGTEARPQAVGELLVAADQQSGLLVVSNLQPLPDDETYQFWVIGDQPLSAGLFLVTEQGTGLLPVSLDRPLSGFAAVGVSIEPAGGSSQPTGDIVMLSELP